MADGIDVEIDFKVEANLEEHLANTVDYAEASVAAAEKSKNLAELIAPVRSGDYRNAFIITRFLGDFYLGNNDWKAHFIEWGTAGAPRLNIPPWPAHATLRRSVRAAGYRLLENKR